MAAILLPTTGYYVPEPEFIGATQILRPAFGGPTQRIGRIGGRRRFTVNVAARSAVEAQAWTRLAEDDQVFALRIPQPGISSGSPGTPLVDGGSQVGNTLAIKGLTANYTLQLGQWLTIIIDDQRYLYRASATSQADGAGSLTAYLNPPLRVSPNNNDAVELAAPAVEGYVTLSRGALSFDAGGAMRPFSFMLEERR